MIVFFQNIVYSFVLKNVIWITDNEAKSLDNISEEDANFFIKADNNNFLQILLSKKAILVEGATEFLLLPKIYKQITGRTVEDDEINIISCNGISYFRYLNAVNDANKKIVVLTDNDNKNTKIEESINYNNEHQHQHIFLDNNTDNWTWEKCFYTLNQETLNSLIEIDENANYLFHEKDYGKVLGKMLNNKVDTAYAMLNSGIDFVIPQYIQDAIKWLNE